MVGSTKHSTLTVTAWGGGGHYMANFGTGSLKQL